MRRLKFAPFFSLVTGFLLVAALCSVPGLFLGNKSTATSATAAETVTPKPRVNAPATQPRSAAANNAAKTQTAKTTQKPVTPPLGVASSNSTRPNPLRSANPPHSGPVTQVSQTQKNSSTVTTESELDFDFTADLPELAPVNEDEYEEFPSLEEMDLPVAAPSPSPLEEESDDADELGGAAPFDTTNTTVPAPRNSSIPLPAQVQPLRTEIDETPLNADPFGTEIDAGAVVRPPTPKLSVPRTREVFEEPQAEARVTRVPQEVQPMEQEEYTYEQDSRQPQEPQGSGTPGPDTLSGTQSPQLSIEKIAPEEIQLNHPASFKTVIRNIGTVTARDVVVRDLLPRGARLVALHPETTVHEDGEVFWNVGDMKPQTETVVEMQFVPYLEGEIGSVATVQFSAEASVKTLVTQALLELEVASEENVLIGENITYNLVLTNPGTGKASGVSVEYIVPEGLVHEKGKKIVYTVGELQPKESKQLPLVLQGIAPGEVASRFRAYGDNNLESIAESMIEVLAPGLQLEIAGPKQRYLNRKAAYTLTVSNPGTAAAFDVDLVAHLPKGIRFEKTNQSGLYDAATHSVRWALAELPAKGVGEMELIVLPEQEGDLTIRLEGHGNQLSDEAEHQVSVRGLPAVGFEVSCLSDPVEVGKPAIYEVKLGNRGTRAAHKVNLFVQLAEGMEFTTAEGGRYQAKGQTIRFEPLSSLAPNEEKVYKFTVRCLQTGDHRISVSASSEEQKTPITKEESTLVYGDE